ncbi:MAG: 3'-5' exonuclease [Akkermansia sp.]|nr:3'-5' exonuclease [Akkermansia sp.]
MNTTALEDLCWAAIDFESAGTAPGETDCPVQVGIVRVEKLFSDSPQLFTSYIACHRPVRWSAAKVHGITTDMLRGAPAFTELWPQLRDMLRGAVVLGHNPATEKRFLKAFPGHGFGPWVDTLPLARQAAPDLQDHALSTLCEALGITHQVSDLIRDAAHSRWHDALFDAAGSLQLLRTLVQALGMHRATLHDIDFCVSC